MDQMHRYDDETDALSRAIVAYARNRIASPQPLDGSAAGEDLTRRAGDTITADGLGGDEALRIWSEILAPATISTDHPSSMAFVPGAPTKASVLFDLIVGSSSTIAAGWIDGAGAIWAENQALRWVADLAGYPADAGGVFVSGGSAGNLRPWSRHGRTRRSAWAGAPTAAGWWRSPTAPIRSIVTATKVMDVGILRIEGDDRGRLEGAAPRPGARCAGARRACDGCSPSSRAPEPPTRARSTISLGSPTCVRPSDLWMHVDGAYGGAGLVAPSVRALYDGIERADSFIVDPHKWLFAPYDCCALLYRDPERARGVFRQEASYLDTVNQEGAAWSEWNPADFAYHLTRRARGLPFWFSLATYGTDAYRDAVEGVLDAHARHGRGDPRARRPGVAAGPRTLRGPVPAHRLERRRL